MIEYKVYDAGADDAARVEETLNQHARAGFHVIATMDVLFILERDTKTVAEVINDAQRPESASRIAYPPGTPITHPDGTVT